MKRKDGTVSFPWTAIHTLWGPAGSSWVTRLSHPSFHLQEHPTNEEMEWEEQLLGERRKKR